MRIAFELRRVGRSLPMWILKVLPSAMLDQDFLASVLVGRPLATDRSKERVRFSDWANITTQSIGFQHFVSTLQ